MGLWEQIRKAYLRIRTWSASVAEDLYRIGSELRGVGHAKRYFIVGKQTKDGTLESDSEKGVLNEYFELGWEYCVSHLYIKRLFVSGTLHPEDVIVTLRDRMFLYEGFWSHVIAYEDFRTMEISEPVIDLCDLIQRDPEHFLPKVNTANVYEHWESDLDTILNIKYCDLSHLNTSAPYCCLHIRYRKWASYRNLSKEFWETLIKKIEASGLNIYIFGKEAAEFANGKNIVHVGLDEYASLLHHPHCRYVIGTVSGGTLIAQACSHAACINYVLIADHKTYGEFLTKNAYRVFHHGTEFNFSGAPISYVSLLDDITEDSFISGEQLLNAL